MDFGTFVDGKDDSSITPGLIAREISSILHGEGYFESIAYGIDFETGTAHGARWYRMRMNVRIGDTQFDLILRPRHLQMSMDKFVEDILWPNLEHLIFRDE